MPITSDTKHRHRFVATARTTQRLAEIRVLLDGIRQLPIGLALKRTMLIQAIWQVAECTGSFYSRYRSERVIKRQGLRIQRDQIYKKPTLIAELLAAQRDLDAIIQQAQCCVVTEDEHRKLHKVDTRLDGWDRYRAAGIAIYDMASRKLVT
jgi:hypothetical protein